MNKPTTFYIARHGETEWNVLRLTQGHSDSPLTEKGFQDAKDLSKKLRNVKFDMIFSSDLLRAQRTAEIVALENNLLVETSKLLRERNFGKLEGKPKEDFHKWLIAFEHLTDKERFSYKSDPDIETDEEITTRLIQFIREIAIANPGKNILAVSHGGIIRSILIHLGYGTYKSLKTIHNGAYLKLESDGVEFNILETDGIVIEK